MNAGHESCNFLIGVTLGIHKEPMSRSTTHSSIKNLTLISKVLHERWVSAIVFWGGGECKNVMEMETRRIPEFCWSRKTKLRLVSTKGRFGMTLI